MYHKYISRTALSFILAAALLMGTLAALQAKPVYPSPKSWLEQAEAPLVAGVSIMQADESGVLFVLNTAPIDYSAAGALVSNGLNVVLQEPGAPELPYYTTYIAVPPEAAVSIVVSQDGVSTLPGVSVPAAAEPTLSYTDSDPDSPFPVTAVSSQPSVRTPNLAIYASDALYPNTLYQLSDPVYVRDMRLVKLDLYPLQYNPLQQELQQTQQMQVNIRFEGAQFDNLRPAPTANDAYQNGASGMILNFEQGKAWRSLPLAENGMAETAVSLPLGAETYKIKINQDGIYDITGADLISAGMDISSVDPAAIEMMTRGETVAYDFIKNGTNNAILESSDIIRFYGEGVNGSRREKQFLTHNVYWLWPNGDPSPIANAANNPGAATATTFTDTITREDENYFFSTWTNQWDQFPNEPDSWYWKLINSPNPQVLTTDILDPVLDGTQSAAYTIEFLTREKYYQTFTYQLDACLNSPAECTQKTWTGHQNINVTKTVPMTALMSGTNNFTITLSNPVNPTTRIYAYLNRISVTYLRRLKARNDQLIFTDAVGGRGMIAQDFSTNNPDNILVWDISTPLSPTQILLDSGDISESGGRYTYTIGIDNSAPQTYIATTISNTRAISPGNISQYIPPTTLDPANGADWVAISYSDFITQANRLAAHRAQADYGGLSTHVVDIEDVVNIYGAGLPMPEAINAYLKNALETWPTQPGYAVLVGDGVISPRNLDCLARCTGDWDKDAQNFIPTDMQFVDRYQGLIPTDSTAVFLAGDDLLADMAVGRLPAETLTQTMNIVDKIIKYEENLYAQTAGSKRVLFLSDFPDPDAGGSFCDTNQNLTGPLLPPDYEQIHLCIEDYADPDAFDPITYTEAIKQETSSGIALMNYRGHGSIQYWGGPSFWKTATSTDDQDLKNMWANEGQPAIVLSADCLDGYFAWPGYTALSERFLRLDDLAGSAAHWSASGLGLDYEHTTLLEGFYKGLFDYGQINIGDTANYAKLYFSLSPNYAESEMYSFNLQGDPAMRIRLPDSYDLFLPVITK